MNNVKNTSRTKVRTMSRIGMLSCIAFVLMYFEMPLAFIAPTFIKMDISDMPALIGGFTMGPVVGIMIAAFKNILKIFIKGTVTGGVGELSNFILNATFAFTAAYIYAKNRTFKGAIMGLLVGTLVTTFCALVSNYFVIFPLYSKFMPMEAIINAGSAVTSRIHDLKSMMLYSILPFNLLKGLIVSVITLLVYKRVSVIFKD